jgi:MoaA/NifB/PqqE/SkfB family radical SAM enzyme
VIATALRWLRIREPERAFEAFQLEVTSRCNLKCVMCPVTVLAEHWPGRDMDWATFERAAQAFARAKWVYLQGWGEPLLHRRLVEMVERAKGAGCRVGFTTNGTRLTPEAGARLIGAGLDLLAVSIAGASAATHEAIRVGSDFGRLIENLRGFVRQRRGRAPKVEILYLMTPANLAELPRAVELAAALGADELAATNLDYVITPGLDALRAYGEGPPARALRAALDEARAAAGRAGIAFRSYPLQFREMAVCDLNPLRILFISAEGDVSPCVYTSLTGQGSIPRIFEGRALVAPVVRFGNLNERRFEDIWESASYREFRAAFAARLRGAASMVLGPLAGGAAAEEPPPPPEACRSCPKLYGI